MPVKRKLNFSSGRGGKKFKSASKKLLARTNYTGDIIKRNLQTFGAAVTRSTAITRVSARYALSSISGGITTGNAVGYQFALNNVAQYADWQNAFDQYRIVAVEIDFMPYFNVITTTAAVQGRLLTAIDLDDATAPASASAVRGFPTCMITPATQRCTRTLVPHVAEALYSGAFSSFGNMNPQWIDTASPGVAHYGIKAWAEPSAATTSTWFVEVRLFVELRNPRLL